MTWSNEYLHILFRLVLAGLMGGIIGLEREVNNHPAGLRTNILVSLGSALIMLLSIYGFQDYYNSGDNMRLDPQRLPAQVISGIGFLGAGTILRHGFTVTGLTTAATIWVVSGIGLAIGAGFYLGGILTTLFVLISLMILAKLDTFIIKKRQLVEIRVNVIDTPGKLAEIASIFGQRKINVKGVTMHDEDKEDGEPPCVSINFLVRMPKNENIHLVIDTIKQIQGVKEVYYGKNNE
ncbi:MgtC/SapB family protein [Tepidibacillus sp. LV47]|uniref:MgtC/SapB family protein n=1 Tax=Tepidibacillus sp. LV47 TaxID=3398228 RepID=UPI003AAEC213